jgi:hypothetical protein
MKSALSFASAEDRFEAVTVTPLKGRQCFFVGASRKRTMPVTGGKEQETN